MDGNYTVMGEMGATTRGLDLIFEEPVWGFRGKNYLLVIGIDTYKHWNPLHCAVKDIEDFTGILLERYQFEKDCVITLKNRKATVKNILKELRNLTKIISDQDNLVVYFSGHGHYDEVTKSGYWIPVNAHGGAEHEDEFLNTAIIVDKLKSVNSLHTFLIIDACFSGTLMAELKASPRSERYKSRRVFTSGRAEVVLDGPKGGNSPFARGILASLANNIAPYLRASELIVEVVEYVEKEAKQTVFNGVLLNSDDQGGDFVFHLKIHEEELWSKTVEKNTVEGYKKFMENFPGSKYSKQAQEALDWGIAAASDTIPAYQAYIDAYQNKKGIYVREAIRRQRNRESMDLWEKTIFGDTISGFNHFIDLFPESPFVEEAKKRIREKGQPRPFAEVPAPREQPVPLSAWQEAQNQNTYSAYLDFTRAFPESEFLAEAQQAMTRLDNLALNQLSILRASEKIPTTAKIEACKSYFKEYPGAKNSDLVKKIRNEMEIEEFKRGL